MKRAALIAAILWMASASFAQAPQSKPAESGQGVVPSSRTDFGADCGIRDTSPQRAMKFTLSPAGKWIAAGAKSSLAGDSTAARAWHEKHWMVDVHDSPGKSSPVIHTAQMCFDEYGQLTRMIDRYMELAECRCMRFTSLSFASDGTVTQREQRFVSEMNGGEIKQPEAARKFPEVRQYRRLDELPFYSLLKK